ncbi:MAG TPA: FAD-dependent monooxygenase, partial [Cyclobacteriaceae bacterium]|nr:FAD-dependent monooxygenase [Cyclobacteriaceae bacterium]
GSCILVADGIHSSIRKKLLPQSQIRYSGYTCWRGIAENTWGIEKVAVEKWGTAGRFGYVPIGDNKVYWFACKNAPQKNEQMQTMTLAQLAENFRNYSHPVPEIIRQTPASELIWGDIIDLKPISRYAFNKVVLLGDAAHATTPNMGQGACMGIEDAWLIATLLQQHANNLTEAFRLFEAQRLKRTHYIVNTSYRLGKIAQWENRILTKLRNTAFRLVPASVNEKQVIKLLDIPVR